MVVVWTVLLTLGMLALALGLMGLVSGRLDRLVLKNRRRLAVLSAVGLLLVFAGSAPPIRAAADAVVVPGEAAAPSIKTVFEQMELRSGGRPDPDVLPEQQTAYEQWEQQILAGYEKAEQALGAVAQVMEALRSKQLDRFTAWVHLARLKQDTNQARLAVHAIVPPAVLDLRMKQRLQQALDGLNESLLSRRRFVAHLQHHVKTMETGELDLAAEELENGRAALIDAVMDIVWVKSRLGLTHERPAATALHAAPAPSVVTALSAPTPAVVSWPGVPCEACPPVWR